MPSKKKKFSARFPPARIKKIMQTDEEVGKVAQAVPVVISRALELFIESLINKTSQTTKAHNAKTVTTQHIKQVILSEKKFDFLKELVSTIPDVQQSEDSPEGCDSGITMADPTTSSGTDKAAQRGRKRGRPRRDTGEDDAQNDDAPPRPKRGRPPKKPSAAVTEQQPDGGGTSEDDSATDDNESESGEEDEEENENDGSVHRNHDSGTGGEGGGSGGGGLTPPSARSGTSSSSSAVAGGTSQPPSGADNVAGLQSAATLPATPVTTAPPTKPSISSPPASAAPRSIAQAPQIHSQGSSAESQAPPPGSGVAQHAAVVPAASAKTVSGNKSPAKGPEPANSDPSPSDVQPTSARSQHPRVASNPSLTNTITNPVSSQQSIHETNKTVPPPSKAPESALKPGESATSASSSVSNSSTVSAAPTSVSKPTNASGDAAKETAPPQNDVASSQDSTTTKNDAKSPVPNKASDEPSSVASEVSSDTETKSTTADVVKSNASLVNSAKGKSVSGEDGSGSALRDEDDSNHSTDSESTAVVGSHAMNMIMSEYDPQMGKPIAASAAMNMIKDQYNNKLADVKLVTSASALPGNSVNSLETRTSAAVVKNESLTLKPGHPLGFMHPKTDTLGNSELGSVKKEEASHESRTLEGQEWHATSGMGLTKKEEGPEAKPEMNSTADSERNEATQSPFAVATTSSGGAINHTPSPGGESPANEMLAAEQTGSPGNMMFSAPSPSAVKSPVVTAAQLAAAAAAPYGLLGAYHRPMVGVPGMLGRIPMVGQAYPQPMLAAHSGMLAAPQFAAGGIPLSAASALPAAQGLPGMPMHLAAPGGVRYAAAPHYLQAAHTMLHTVPAATGPYSHLGVPGPDPYLAALAPMGVHTAQAAMQAAPMAAAQLYPQLQMAQAPAMPQFAVYPRVPYQGLNLPRPPT